MDKAALEKELAELEAQLQAGLKARAELVKRIDATTNDLVEMQGAIKHTRALIAKLSV